MTEQTASDMLARTRKQFNLESDEAAFKHLCDLQGMTPELTETRWRDFNVAPSNLPRIVFEGYLTHVCDLSTA